MFNIFAIGFTNFLYRAIFGVSTEKAKVEILPTIEIPGFSKIPWIGEILFRQNILVYLALIAAFLALFVLRRTKFGLQIEATGENPKAAQASGIRVRRIRYGGNLFCGFMAGIGGAFLSCGIVGTFTENMSATTLMPVSLPARTASSMLPSATTPSTTAYFAPSRAASAKYL
jgi:ABC-type uncharacterized transport system permease subunit